MTNSSLNHSPLMTDRQTGGATTAKQRRRSGRPRTPRWQALLLATLVGLASMGGARYGAEPGPEAAGVKLEGLVNDLGAADYDTREAAAKALLAAGYAAKDALAGRLNDPDPEMRDRARKLYAEVRLLVVPGAQQAEIEAVVAAAKASPGDERQWRVFVHKYGAKTVKLLLELADSGPAGTQPDGKPVAGTQVQGKPAPANGAVQNLFQAGNDDDDDDDDDDVPRQSQESIALAKILGTGLTVTLEGTSGEAVAQEIAAMPAASRARGVLLLETAAVNGGMASYALYHTWLALGEPERAFEEGRRLWLAYPSDTLLAELGDLVTAHKLGEVVWQNAGARLLALEDGDVDELLIFYVLTAQRTGNPEVIKTLLTVTDQDSDGRLNLAIAAMAHSSFSAVPVLLEGDASNAANLLRQWALQGQKDGAPISDAAWQTQLASLKDEADAFRLAELLSSFDHDRQVAAWEYVMTMPPNDSVRDGEALIRLSDLARLDGQFTLSATRMEAGLDLLAKIGQPHPRDKALRRVLPSLREMGEDGDLAFNAAIQRGRTALAKRHFTDALTYFQAAQQERPDDLSTALLLLRASKYANQITPLQEAREFLRDAEPESLDDRLSLAYLLVDVHEMDAAEKHAKLLIASAPRSPSGLLIMAQIRERQWNFREAIKLTRQAITMGVDDNELYRSLAIIYAESGDFASAEALLIKYLRDAPDEPYGRIMLWVVRSRMGYDDAASVGTYLRYLKPAADSWDAKLLQYCAGELAADALLKAAETAADPILVPGQRCEANFYIGQAQMARGDTASARASFETVIGFGITIFIEHTWALAELRHLAEPVDGAAPPNPGGTTP